MGQSYVQKKRPDGTFDLVPREELSAWMAKHYPDRSTGKPIKFKRVERGSWVWRDGKLIPKSAQIYQFPRGPQIIKDIEPFRNIAVDRNQVIGGRRQKRDMMRAYNLIECGDMRKTPEHSGPQYDARKHQASVVSSLKQALHKHGLGD